MKKFALLGAVAALATAGGVFAAWNYSEGKFDMTDSVNTITIGVEQATSTGEVGSATVSGQLAGTFVQKASTSYGIDFVADNEKNTITTNYTSKSDVNETVVISYTLNIDWAEGKALPTGVTIEAKPITGVEETLNVTSKSYSTTMSNEWFTITGELKTKAAYDTFVAAIGAAKFTLTVDVVAQ